MNKKSTNNTYRVQHYLMEIGTHIWTFPWLGYLSAWYLQSIVYFSCQAYWQHQSSLLEFLAHRQRAGFWRGPLHMYGRSYQPRSWQRPQKTCYLFRNGWWFGTMFPVVNIPDVVYILAKNPQYWKRKFEIYFKNCIFSTMF